MFTLVIFWQERKLNEEIDWFLDRNNEEICIMTVDNDAEHDMELDDFRDEISSRVNDREQWRLFLVDNYSYQCISHNKQDECTACCCCTAGCKDEICGMGRNPFISSAVIKNERNKKHREQLLNLMNGILDVSHTEFQQPKDMFVIAVRDGGFSCKQEINIPNLENEYWRVAEEFPAFCRYLVYDINEIYKGLFEREMYWLYCLILLLSRNEFYMDQLLPRSMYRIEAEYSIVEYYKYLNACRKEVEEQLVLLEKKRIDCENDANIKERALFNYPITLNSKRIRLRNSLNMIPEGDRWDNAKMKVKHDIDQIYHNVPKEYEEQWEELRNMVSDEEGENAQVCSDEKKMYENQLLSMSFRKEPETVELFEKDKSEESLIKAFHKTVYVYEETEKNKLSCRGYCICAIILFFGSWVVFGPIGTNIMTCKGLSCLVIGTLILYGVVMYVKREAQRYKMNVLLKSIENYQSYLDDARKNFLMKTRNVMIYWKREQNLKKHNEEIMKMKQEIEIQEKACRKRKEKLDVLWNKGEDEADIAAKRIRKMRKEAKICIGSREVETEFSFIENIRFYKIEKRRGRNT